ncbi:glycosyltransferase family 2 protein [Sinorhizobium numidicum]|uniref:Glycosyltransferase family 2 protein n=1 Tax=Sinorhizobium numidicum TaxID=680248 RepID=A0ABY8CUD3_9HYPH|nr:glycosyltransferase family 2 protein [Sinorhizobium numidicum]WEX74942.1 glycosyltransferase family 2 protein [Sinorhizobium numidicum]WEX80935.1 glycosyltransferase family 2 protein [Sinorhizobium numidicum]
MLSTFLCYAVFGVSAALSIPSALYAMECLIGSLPLRTRRLAGLGRKGDAAVSVLVPAHNEENGIATTLASIGRQLGDRDRLVVVADNCSDRTAAVARAAGAEVIERFDAQRRGKGFALDAGLRYLEKAPPDIVMLVDADCDLGANALESLVAAVVDSGRPAQSRNLMTAPAAAGLNFSVAEFAFLVKNYVRPLGLTRLGLPCQATGTGFAIPWQALRCVDVAHASRVEDMKLGLDLASAGYAPRFCEHALVTSQFPFSKEGANSQRRRWEGGHLDMIRTELRSLVDPLILRNLARLALTLDLMVPPLTLLGLLLVSMMLVAGVIAAADVSVWPLVIGATNLLLVLLATVVAWLVHGRKALPASAIGKIPRYVLWKLKLYPTALLGGTKEGWIRTDRKKKISGENRT